MDPIISDAIAKGSASVIGFYLIVKAVSLVEKIILSRFRSEERTAKRAEDAFADRDKTLDGTLKYVAETQRQSVTIQDRAIDAYQDAAKTFADSSRMIAEEMRSTRMILDVMNGKIENVPVRTQNLITGDLGKILGAVEELSQLIKSYTPPEKQ